MNTEKIRVKFCEVRCIKDHYTHGYGKEFHYGAPDTEYIEKAEDLLDLIREKMFIDEDVHVYIDEHEYSDEGYYIVSWLSGSHEWGCKPSEHQKERWRAGKCVLWAFNMVIKVSRVRETPLTGLKID